jgi:hypothetical protein
MHLQGLSLNYKQGRHRQADKVDIPRTTLHLESYGITVMFVSECRSLNVSKRERPAIRTTFACVWGSNHYYYRNYLRRNVPGLPL